MKRNGFTLVELAIVLVIIGLLLGGILAAQSMIGTAKLHRQVTQLQQFDVAVGLFKQKFNQFPGDDNLFNPVGNNDGQVAGAFGYPISYNSAGTLSEVGYFWKDLSDSGMISEKYNNSYLTAGVKAGVNIPAGFIGSNTIIAGIYEIPGSYNMMYNEGHYWQLCYNPAVSNNTFCENEPNTFPDYGTFTMTPAEALSIDVKIDDGMPFTGNVNPTNPLGGWPAFSFNCVTKDYPDATAKYTTSFKQNSCNLRVRMGSSVGNRL